MVGNNFLDLFLSNEFIRLAPLKFTLTGNNRLVYLKKKNYLKWPLNNQDIFFVPQDLSLRVTPVCPLFNVRYVFVKCL